MTQFKDKYRVESTRLKGWDYSSASLYFITTNTKNNINFFGKIENDKIILSSLGHIANDYWLAIPKHYPEFDIDQFQIMPNHIHAILILKDDDYLDKRHSVGDVVGKFKAGVSRWARKNGYPEFSWQERFYDRVIRNEFELQKIRHYIMYNSCK